MKTEKQMYQWIKENVALTLDRFTPADAAAWLEIAEEETRLFFKLGTHAPSLRRKRMKQPQPKSQKELMAFLLEFRIKVQMISDGYQNLPPVPLFEWGDKRFYMCEAFTQVQLLASERGGNA